MDIESGALLFKSWILSHPWAFRYHTTPNSDTIGLQILKVHLKLKVLKSPKRYISGQRNVLLDFGPLSFKKWCNHAKRKLFFAQKKIAFSFFSGTTPKLRTLLRITRLVHRSHIWSLFAPSSPKKLTKSEIRSSSSRLEHCSESLI